MFEEVRFPTNEEIGLLYLSSTNYRELQRKFYQHHAVQEGIKKYIFKFENKNWKNKKKIPNNCHL